VTGLRWAFFSSIGVPPIHMETQIQIVATSKATHHGIRRRGKWCRTPLSNSWPHRSCQSSSGSPGSRPNHRTTYPHPSVTMPGISGRNQSVRLARSGEPPVGGVELEPTVDGAWSLVGAEVAWAGAAGIAPCHPWALSLSATLDQSAELGGLGELVGLGSTGRLMSGAAGGLKGGEDDAARCFRLPTGGDPFRRPKPGKTWRQVLRTQNDLRAMRGFASHSWSPSLQSVFPLSGIFPSLAELFAGGFDLARPRMRSSYLKG